MADTTATTTAETAPASPVQKGQTASKMSKSLTRKPSHPSTSLNNAIKSLKERGGSSFQAIKKYIAVNYKVDAEQMSPFIKTNLKGAVANGILMQTKGKGASRFFKLAIAAAAGKTAAGMTKTTAKRVAKPTTAKKAAGDAAAKKVEKPAKKPAEKKVAAANKMKAAAKPKALKAKEATKAGPTKKLKAPKPKLAKKPTAVKASPKKAAAPKIK